MYKKKSYNGLLILGIVSIIAGLSLLIYCITSYSEIKLVTDKIDFDELDNNIQISTSDKYYKYLSIWDTLNDKLEKNKNLPVKNMSCAYLDYSQHNIKSMYKLIFKSANEDSARRSVVEGNIKTLQELYKNYKSCRKTALYMDELDKMLVEIDNADDIFYQGRMDTFLTGKHEIERTDVGSAQKTETAEYGNQYQEVYSDNGAVEYNNNAQNKSSVSLNAKQDEQYRKVEQYIEPNDKSRSDSQNGRIYYGETQTFSIEHKN